MITLPTCDASNRQTRPQQCHGDREPRGAQIRSKEQQQQRLAHQQGDQARPDDELGREPAP